MVRDNAQGKENQILRGMCNNLAHNIGHYVPNSIKQPKGCRGATGAPRRQFLIPPTANTPRTLEKPVCRKEQQQELCQDTHHHPV